MKLTGNTILITGGATGIGLAMAEEFINLGNTVIICGRREFKLMEAKKKLPSLHTIVCDVAKKESREFLFNKVTHDFPNLNILVNNAGIQREVLFTKENFDPVEMTKEVEINLIAPIHLSGIFVQHLIKHESAIINITSGLGFTPIAIMPVYCSTKAALHSISLSLRHQLAKTSVKVFEIIPPIVDTELDQGARDRRNQTDRGMRPGECAKEIMKAIETDTYEAAIGAAAGLRQKREEAFSMLNRW